VPQLRTNNETIVCLETGAIFSQFLLFDNM
jgi:hypothetical protein